MCYCITPHQIFIQHNLQHQVIYTICGTISKQLVQPSQHWVTFFHNYADWLKYSGRSVSNDQENCQHFCTYYIVFVKDNISGVRRQRTRTVQIILSLKNVTFNNIMTGHKHQNIWNIQYSFMLKNCKQWNTLSSKDSFFINAKTRNETAPQDSFWVVHTGQHS